MTRTILIVDDEPNIVLSLEYLMQQTGYTVRTAVDGAQALQSIAELPPDLVLLDINIPEINGFEVCSTVRANPEWAQVRILMLTAKGRDVEREKGMAMGADDYLTKPFATQEVIDKVRELLGEERA